MVWRILAAALVILIAAGTSIYLLDQMRIIDVSEFLLDRALSIPAVSEHATIYQLGLQRRQEIDALKSDLSRERLAVEEEARALAREWQAIEAAKRNLQQEEARLEAERAALAAAWEALETARFEQAQWEHLIRSYQRMRPGEFAAIAAELPDEVLIRILSELAERQAGEFLAVLDPSRAARITVLLAEAID